MFEPLKDAALFRQAKVDLELETVVWPNGADLAPNFFISKSRRTSSQMDEGARN